MSADFISRIIGMILFSIGGLFLGVRLAELGDMSAYLYGTTFFLVGAFTGLVLTPYLTIKPLRTIRHQLRRMPVQQLVAGTIGLVVGLIIAALLAFPLSLLPAPFKQLLPFLGALLFGYLGVIAMTARQQEVFNFIRGYRSTEHEEESSSNLGPPVLLDTSVIIDGRVADISRTGFLNGELLVPTFILNELQHIADSPDTLRRNRGRRGLDILRRLQEESVSPVRIMDVDVDGVREVDDKLVLLAKQLHCAIVTNDFNLNRVAELQGVPVLNINELANAVKTVFLPGESLMVNVIQEGKETDQGVGYLDDGTMVVVENGRSYIGTNLETMVTKVLQTAAGRMLFARPIENES
jgi:uncharacterized protein YacL